MDNASVLDIATQGLLLAAKLAAPVLITSLLVGLSISIFQSMTQIQEITLTFVPKAIAVAIAILVAGNWMISELVNFTQGMFDLIPSLLNS